VRENAKNSSLRRPAEAGCTNRYFVKKCLNPNFETEMDDRENCEYNQAFLIGNKCSIFHVIYFENGSSNHCLEELSLGKYRSKLDIVADILRVAGQNPKKTQIMYQANLSYKVLQKYLKETLAASLICHSEEESCYKLTGKGREFLDAYQGYAKTSRRCEERLNEVESKKNKLENMCSCEE
jgi:predicted transcriptional regulator